jgi:hypothetical protein
MKQQNKEELYNQFKTEQMPIFRILGLSQLSLFVITVLLIPLIIWIDWRIVLKVDITCVVFAILISIAYNLLDKKLRVEFDKQFADYE